VVLQRPLRPESRYELHEHDLDVAAGCQQLRRREPALAPFKRSTHRNARDRVVARRAWALL